MTRRKWTALISSFGLLMLILDAKTALYGAGQGVDICIRSLMPSLFPFFVISILLTGAMNGISIPILRPLGQLCGIPEGGESLLAVGLLGGYPVGAQAVSQAFRDGKLSKATAQRLLSFCSNAGPAFFFGIVAAKFPHYWMGWVLWGIHILSALLVGMIFPKKEKCAVQVEPGQPVTLSDALSRSIRVMSGVCGWVILFRVIIAFLERWVLWLLPSDVQIVLTGILELANGCCQLGQIESVGSRFIIASGILAFGGVCVTMQTVTATQGLGLGCYLPGKILQTFISVVLAFLCQLFFFPREDVVTIPLSFGTAVPLLIALGAIVLREIKNRGSILARTGV